MQTRIVLTFFILFFAGQTVEGQFLKKLGKRAEKAAENAVIKKTEQKVTKETEKAMDTLLTGPDKKTNQKKKTESGQPPANEDGVDTKEEKEQNTASDTPKLWSKYNFVPGDEIIFYDDLSGEENGEFPSRWDIAKGNAENAVFDGENVIAMKQYTLIFPLMDSHDYLPEVFTLEFDAYFDADAATSRFRYYLNLWPGQSSYYYFGEGKDFVTPISLYETGLRMNAELSGMRRNYDTNKAALDTKGGSWKHMAIAFNKRSLKVFIDEYRVLNIPNLGFKPQMFAIGCHDQWDSDDVKIRAIKNVRLAKGGKKLYDRVIADGKFVTRGILFDVNSANIKPESAGVINEVGKMMQEHQDLSFRIEGHTDSDGADDYNRTLSAKRAQAVKEALVALGIASARMQTEGMGEVVPVSDNSTPEGKANNRRVEFIKL